MNLYNKIKDAAMKIFNEKGFEGTTIREICKRAGVTAPSIYLRYGSKENLYIEIFNECRDHYYNYIRDIIKKNKEKSIEKQLFKIFNGRITYYLKYKENYKFYFRVYSFPSKELKHKLSIKTNDNYLSSFRNTAEIFSRAIKEKVIKEMDVEKLLKTFCSILQGYMFQLISFDELPKEEDILIFWQVFWTGIKY